MKHIISRPLRIFIALVLIGAVLFAAVTPASALNNFLKTWQDVYPHSTSDSADCSLCHGTSTSNLNSYGKDLCVAFGGSIPADITSALRAIENLDSDMNGDSNLVEIDAGAQPGWTFGDSNQIYSQDGCLPIGAPIDAPSSVPLPYDPPVGGAPLAVPGGPYTGNVNVPVTFDGSGSFDSDGGSIVSYTWDFGDGTIGTGAIVQHTYSMAATYTVSLTVVDEEGMSNTNMTTATISGEAVLDLDIAAFSVTKSQRIGKAVTIKLTVENKGAILGQSLATVVGVQNGTTVYSWSLNVYDYNTGGSTSFNFPAYTPTAKGTINWTVTIYDVDPDVDMASATTVVK